jgi:hypothetical protein
MKEMLFIKLIFAAGFLLLGIAFVLFYTHLVPLSNFFIIRFDSLRGINFLGEQKDALGILISGLSLNLINVFLAKTFYNRNKFLSYLLSFFNVFISLLILIWIGVIITVN